MPDPADPADPATRRRRQNLERVAAALRDLHRTLVDEARSDYEAEHGPLPSPAALLDRLMRDPSLQWLRELSAAMVELDEMLDDPEAPTPAQAMAAQRRFEWLVTGDSGAFAVRYREYLQRSTEVVIAHAAVRLALRPLA